MTPLSGRRGRKLCAYFGPYRTKSKEFIRKYCIDQSNNQIVLDTGDFSMSMGNFSDWLSSK